MGAKIIKTSVDYFEFLKEVYNKITNGEKILLQPFTREQGIPAITSAIMKSGGIIKNTGSKKVPKYVWNTCIPNVKMAEKLFEEVYKHNKKYQDKYREDKKSLINSSTETDSSTELKGDFIPAWTLQDSNVSEEENAVILLKSLGYRIMKPITQWEEI